MTLQKYILKETTSSFLPISEAEELELFHIIESKFDVSINTSRTIGSGGEGIIFSSLDKKYAIKIFFDPHEIYEDLNDMKVTPSHILPILDYIEDDGKIVALKMPMVDENPIAHETEQENFTIFGLVYEHFYEYQKYETDILTNKILDQYNLDIEYDELDRYISDCFEIINQAIDHGLNIDPIDDNIMYDKNKRNYVLIDYLTII